jgi:hypothetical protein
MLTVSLAVVLKALCVAAMAGLAVAGRRHTARSQARRAAYLKLTLTRPFTFRG